MTTSLVVLVVLLLVALAAWRLRSGGTKSAPSDNMDTLAAWPPSATRVLNNAERQTYELLRHALPGQMILAQVPLQRFIKVPTRNSYAEWLRRVGQLNADFVVCDPHSQVMAVIEIEAEDDQPGSRAQRRRERMLRVLKSAHVPVHVWRAGALPTVGQVREAILPAAEVPQLSDAVPSPQLREPPPSTWFDDFDSGHVPLASAPAPTPKSVK